MLKRVHHGCPLLLRLPASLQQTCTTKKASTVLHNDHLRPGPVEAAATPDVGELLRLDSSAAAQLALKPRETLQHPETSASILKCASAGVLSVSGTVPSTESTHTQVSSAGSTLSSQKQHTAVMTQHNTQKIRLVLLYSSERRRGLIKYLLYASTTLQCSKAKPHMAACGCQVREYSE